MNRKFSPSTWEQEEEDVLVEELVEDRFALILHNDDVNTFDHVIDSLIEICDHEPEQAEQCAFIVHYKGKCDVKHGSFERLAPRKRALNSKGLEATIEKA